MKAFFRLEYANKYQRQKYTQSNKFHKAWSETEQGELRKYMEKFKEQEQPELYHTMNGEG